MPSTAGLRLLVRLHVLNTDIEIGANKHGRLRMTEEQVSMDVVYSLAEAGYLINCGPNCYKLSEKGRAVAERPSAWKHQGMSPGMLHKAGVLVHTWHEYLLVDQYVDYVSYCGLNRSDIFAVDLKTKKAICPACQVGFDVLKKSAQ